MEREVFTKQQVIDLLCISSSTFDNMIRAGLFPEGFRKKGNKNKLWYKDTIEFLYKKDGEIWKDVVDYEGLYLVSDLGRVKNAKSGKLVMQSLVAASGYKRVTLHKNNIPKTCLIHRLVAQAFIPNPNNHNIVNHIDENKINNIVSNLEWCSQSDNIKHHYSGVTAKRLTKYIILRISQDGSSVEKYSNIPGAARANNINSSHLREIIESTRVLNGYIWIKLATY